MTLPTGLEADKAKATFENGMLRLAIPKAEQAKPRQIRITPVSDGACRADKRGARRAQGLTRGPRQT